MKAIATVTKLKIVDLNHLVLVPAFGTGWTFEDRKDAQHHTLITHCIKVVELRWIAK
jgi:hypothetical protein